MVETEGPSYDYASPTLYLPWRHPGGDWVDANGVEQGVAPYATIQLREGTPGYVSADVTVLVKKLLSDNTGFLIGARRIKGSGPKFASQANPSKAPRLIVTTSKGVHEAPLLLDTWVSVTSNRSLAQEPIWSVGDPRDKHEYGNGMLRFDLSRVQGNVSSATLSIWLHSYYGEYDLPVYELAVPELLTSPAAQHPGRVEAGGGVPWDQMPARATIAQIQAWYDDGWVSSVSYPAVMVDWPEYGVKAIRARAGPLGATGINARKVFVKRAGPRKSYQVPTSYEAPTHLFTRYAIKVGETVKDCANLGQKTPGTTGTWQNVNSIGWPADELYDADLGWAFNLNHTLHSKANDAVGVLWYFYSFGGHRFSSPDRGDTIPFGVAYRPGQVYSVEYEIKLNTLDDQVARSDGVFRLWIDGVRVYENVAVKYRGHPAANIMAVVTQTLHGGNGVPGCEMWHEVAGLAFGDTYIGPLKRLR